MDFSRLLLPSVPVQSSNSYHAIESCEYSVEAQLVTRDNQYVDHLTDLIRKKEASCVLEDQWDLILPDRSLAEN
jgi:hypothetical protein